MIMVLSMIRLKLSVLRFIRFVLILVFIMFVISISIESGIIIVVSKVVCTLPNIISSMIIMRIVFLSRFFCIVVMVRFMRLVWS